MDWLWQGIVTNGLYGLIVLLGGLVIAIGRARRWRWITPVLYGLGASGILAVIVTVFLIWTVLPERRVTLNTVETDIRSWLDAWHLSVTKINEPESYFKFSVTLSPGTGAIMVSRPRSHDHYIFLRTSLVPDPISHSNLDKLSLIQLAELVTQLRIEMARVHTDVMSLAHPLVMDILIPIPITSSLNEALFMNRLNDLHSDAELLRNTFLQLHAIA